MARFPAFFDEVAGRVGIRPQAEFEIGEWAAPWIRVAGANPGHLDEESVELAPYALSEGGFWPEHRVHDLDRAIWSNESLHCFSPADAIAEYLPWHLHGDKWGIVIYEYELVLFTETIAGLVGCRADRLAPFVLRQVLAHEYTHFAFEVAGTTLEDVLGAPLYADYVLRRYRGPNRWSLGPLEEVVATWAEQAFVERPSPAGLGRKPRGFVNAVAQVNGKAPPGNRDFDQMRDPRRAERIVADAATAIAQRPLWNGRWWPGAEEEERQQVPIVWRGDARTAMAFGAFPKSLAPPSIHQFERWIQVVGGTCRPGAKHWKVTLPNGRRCGDTKPADHLYVPEATRIARVLGVANARQLYVHIDNGTYPESLAPA